jgi:hypothetical protein
MMSFSLNQNSSGCNFPCNSGFACRYSQAPSIIKDGDFYIHAYDGAICMTCAPYYLNDLFSDLIYIAEELVKDTPTKMGSEMIYLLGANPKLLLEE